MTSTTATKAPLFSGAVSLHTASWVVPDDTCLDCEPGHRPVDDGGTYLTIRVPSQAFPVSLGCRVELTISAPEVSA